MTSSLALAIEMGGGARGHRRHHRRTSDTERSDPTRPRLAHWDAACISDGRKNEFGGNELGRRASCTTFSGIKLWRHRVEIRTDLSQLHRWPLGRCRRWTSSRDPGSVGRFASCRHCPQRQRGRRARGAGRPGGAGRRLGTHVGDRSRPHPASDRRGRSENIELLAESKHGTSASRSSRHGPTSRRWRATSNSTAPPPRGSWRQHPLPDGIYGHHALWPHA